MGEERIRAASHREELAWAAGFWDGEGSCGCYLRNDGRTRKSSNAYIRASVNQNEREPLDRFIAAVEIGKVYGPYYAVGRKNPQWSYQLHGTEAVTLLFERLWPWLCSIKRSQFLVTKEKFENRPDEGMRNGRSCPPDCTCGRHGRYSTEGLTEKQIRRREKMREYQARHRAKKRVSSHD